MATAANISVKLAANHAKATNINNGIRLFSAENDSMDPFVPTDLSFAARYKYLLLPKLNEISQMLIAPVHTYMKVFRLQGGGTRYEGKHFVNLISEINYNHITLNTKQFICDLFQVPFLMLNRI